MTLGDFAYGFWMAIRQYVVDHWLLVGTVLFAVIILTWKGRS